MLHVLRQLLMIDDHSLSLGIGRFRVFSQKKTVGTAKLKWQFIGYRFCSIIVGGSYICFLGQGRFIQLADWLTTLFQRMWHLRSNYKTSFLWLLVSPRKSPLLKLNLQSHEKISSSPLLVCQPTSCSSASPMQCLKSLGVPLWGVYWDRCNGDGCYFGCWLIRFQRSFLLLTIY